MQTRLALIEAELRTISTNNLVMAKAINNLVSKVNKLEKQLKNEKEPQKKLSKEEDK